MNVLGAPIAELTVLRVSTNMPKTNSKTGATSPSKKPARIGGVLLLLDESYTDNSE
jgi:hypothetical protein